MATPRFTLEHTAILVVDLQERLVPHMHNPAALIQQVGRLTDGANALGVPLLVTEQYRQGLGVTVPEIASRLTGAACNHDKLKFSACIEPVREELSKRGIRSVVVCGIEAHVCVLQTCLDLIDTGYVAAVVIDAIGSRRTSDQEAAVQRMVQAGVVPTTVESILMELVHEAGTPRFKAVLPFIK
jgi:nicotinamidase-related amidase